MPRWTPRAGTPRAGPPGRAAGRLRWAPDAEDTRPEPIVLVVTTSCSVAAEHSFSRTVTAPFGLSRSLFDIGGLPPRLLRSRCEPDARPRCRECSDPTSRAGRQAGDRGRSLRLRGSGHSARKRRVMVRGGVVRVGRRRARLHRLGLDQRRARRPCYHEEYPYYWRVVGPRLAEDPRLVTTLRDAPRVT